MMYHHLPRQIIDPDTLPDEQSTPRTVETNNKLPHSSVEADTVISGSGNGTYRSKPKINTRAIAGSNWPTEPHAASSPATSLAGGRRSNALTLSRSIVQPEAKHTMTQKYRHSTFTKGALTKSQLEPDDAAGPESVLSDSKTEVDKSSSEANDAHGSVNPDTEEELQFDETNSSESADSADENSEQESSSVSDSEASLHGEDEDDTSEESDTSAESDTSTESDTSAPGHRLKSKQRLLTNDGAPQSSDSESDAEEAEPLPAQHRDRPKQKTETRAIYVRIPAATSKTVRRNLTRVLRDEYVGAMIFQDNSQTKTLFEDRDALTLLWQHIEDRRIDCLLIPHINHICKSKDAFQLFVWMCDVHDVRICIIPGLLLAIKSARTLAK